MKDIENRHGDLITYVKSLARKKNVKFFHHNELYPIAKDLGYQKDVSLIGAGHECVVVTSRDTPDIVVAFTYQDLTPAETKQIYLVHRVFSTLFPQNFPRFYASYGGEYSRTVRQRIRRGISPVTHPFSAIQAEMLFNWGKNGGGISSVHFDAAAFNYVTADDGGQYYLDTISVNTGILRELGRSEVRASIAQFMDRNSLGARDVDIVNRSLRRLMTISP